MKLLHAVFILCLFALQAAGTISSTTIRSDYTANGNTNTYAYGFRVTDQSHLLVTVRDSDEDETTLTIATHYTVTGVGDSGGGNVVLVNGAFDWIDAQGDLESGYTISIRMNVPLTQSTDLRNQGDYLPETVEDAFDYQTRMNQQQQDLIDRSVKLPETVDPGDVSVELPVPVASTFLQWNAGATALTNAAVLSAYTVSNFAATLLDDTTAAAARTTLDVSQAINSLTALTLPAEGDLLATYDASASGERKITWENALKVIASLPEDTAPAGGDSLLSYDVSAAAAKSVKLGMLTTRLARPGSFANLGVVNATTTNANDSIKIQGNLAALSSTNPLYIAMRHSSSAGLMTVFSMTSDVTINLTGAHWGLGTKGDFTDVQLRLYAINHGGILQWGVSNKGGLTIITDTDTSTTATNITAQNKMLVSSALSAGSYPCVEVGWFNANFDDAGGAAEDLWAVQTGVEDINVGLPVRDRTDWTTFTPTGGWSTNTTYTGRYRRNGDTMEYEVLVAVSGAPTSANLSVNLPTGHVVDTTKLTSTATPSIIGVLEGVDTNPWSGVVEYSSTTAVLARFTDSDAAQNESLATIDATSPMTFASGDKVHMRFAVPLLGLSSN